MPAGPRVDRAGWTAGRPGRPGRAAVPAVPAALADAPLTRDWSPPYPVDVRLVLSVHRRGTRDPAYRTDAYGAVWRTVLTPDGPGTLRVAARPAARRGAAAPRFPAGTGTRVTGGGVGTGRRLAAGDAAAAARRDR